MTKIPVLFRPKSVVVDGEGLLEDANVVCGHSFPMSHGRVDTGNEEALWTLAGVANCTDLPQSTRILGL